MNSLEVINQLLESNRLLSNVYLSRNLVALLGLHLSWHLNAGLPILFFISLKKKFTSEIKNTFFRPKNVLFRNLLFLYKSLNINIYIFFLNFELVSFPGYIVETRLVLGPACTPLSAPVSEPELAWLRTSIGT